MDQFQMTPYEYEQEQYRRLKEFEAQQQRMLPSGVGGKIQGGASFVARWGAAIIAMVISFFAFNMIIQLVIAPRLSPGGNLEGLLTIVFGIIAPVCILFTVKNYVKKKLAMKTAAMNQQINEAIEAKRTETRRDVQDYARRYEAWRAGKG